MAESQPTNPIAAAHAKAYKAYLQSLKESLANVDIEAVDVAKPLVIPLPTLATFHTLSCWHTINTINTINTAHSINTLASFHSESCIE
jgi:hypothetical protein